MIFVVGFEEVGQDLYGLKTVVHGVLLVEAQLSYSDSWFVPTINLNLKDSGEAATSTIAKLGMGSREFAPAVDTYSPLTT